MFPHFYTIFIYNTSEEITFRSMEAAKEFCKTFHLTIDEDCEIIEEM